jgi:putative transposase
MPRKKIIRTDQFPYHITARANNKQFFDIPTEEVWKILCELIQRAEQPPLNAQIPCFVLMNNHFHLLVWTPNANLDKLMHFIMKKMADAINTRSQRINHVFGGPYKWCLIQQQNYYANVIRYICQNPLRAGLCHKIENYPFLRIPKHNILSDFRDQKTFQYWLNHSVSEDEQVAMRKGLYRREFKLGRDPKTRRRFELSS